MLERISTEGRDDRVCYYGNLECLFVFECVRVCVYTYVYLCLSVCVLDICAFVCLCVCKCRHNHCAMQVKHAGKENKGQLKCEIWFKKKRAKTECVQVQGFASARNGEEQGEYNGQQIRVNTNRDA